MNSDDLDYLALTGIPEEFWDAFTIWVSTHIRNYRDWDRVINRTNAIRGEGSFIDELGWSYRKGDVVSRWYGYDVTETWEYSERLTTILRAAATAMVETTGQQIAQLATEPGVRSGPAYVDPDRFYSQAVYTDKPQAIGKKKRFRRDIQEPKLFSLGWPLSPRTFHGWPHDSVFYVFPNSASPREVPDGWVVVGGADYNTYALIYANNRGSRDPELMLARVKDLEDTL